MVAVVWLAETISASWWVTDRMRVELGEKTEKFIRKELKGLYSQQRFGSEWIEDVLGRADPICG